jgi:hypothetical protein
MAYFAHADVLENGPAYVKANATKILLVSTYTFGDSYATVVANTISEAAVTTANWAWTTSGNDRVLTSTDNLTGSAAAAGADGTTVQYVVVDATNSKVLYSTEEGSDQPITAGNPITLKSVVIKATQPTLAV